jgi:phosphopantetheinyl transferase
MSGRADPAGRIVVPCPRDSVHACLLPLDRLARLPRRGIAFLTAAERERQRGMGDARRRTEWRAARVCLKSLLVDLGWIAGPAECEIDSAPNGRPRLHFLAPDAPAFRGDISLSHKGAFALAAATAEPRLRIGADVEPVSPRPWRLRKAWESPADSLHPRDGGDDLRYTILWSVKEAASKVSGEGIWTPFRDLVCAATGEDRCRVKKGVCFLAEVRYSVVQNHVVSVACAPSGV